MMYIIYIHPKRNKIREFSILSLHLRDIIFQTNKLEFTDLKYA